MLFGQILSFVISGGLAPSRPRKNVVFRGARRAGTARSPPSPVAPLRVAGFRFLDSSSVVEGIDGLVVGVAFRRVLDGALDEDADVGVRE